MVGSVREAVERCGQGRWLDARAAFDGVPADAMAPVELEWLAPGLYFMGLAFQSAFASMLLLGAGQDAEYVVGHLDRRMARRPTSSAASGRVPASVAGRFGTSPLDPA